MIGSKPIYVGQHKRSLNRFYNPLSTCLLVREGEEIDQDAGSKDFVLNKFQHAVYLSSLSSLRGRHFLQPPYVSKKPRISEDSWFNMDLLEFKVYKDYLFIPEKNVKENGWLISGLMARQRKEKSSVEASCNSAIAWQRLLFLRAWCGPHKKELYVIRNPPKKPIWRDESQQSVPPESASWEVTNDSERSVTSGAYKGIIFSDVCVRGGHERSLQES